MCGNAGAMMPMLGGGGAVDGEGGGGEPVCDCAVNMGEDGTTPNASYVNGASLSQSFKSPGTDTNVTITWKTSNTNSVPAAYTVYLDNDRDFSADTFGSANGTVTANLTEECVEITSSTELTAGSTYYFMVRSTVAYSYRFTARINEADYTDGTFCTKGSADLNHTTGQSCPTGDDLTFKVCVGADCSCD